MHGTAETEVDEFYFTAKSILIIEILSFTRLIV